MFKRYDTTQQSWIDANSAKRYDTTQQSWVDIGSAKTYDTTEQAWVDKWCEFFDLVESKVQSENTSLEIYDNGDGVVARFGDYYTDYYAFSIDNPNVPVGSTISFGQLFSDTSLVHIRLRVYLRDWGNGISPYYDIPTNGQGGSTYTLTTHSDYGPITKIRIDLKREEETWTYDTDFVRVYNVTVDNKKFKFRSN